MKPVAIYARYSSDKQTEQSIERTIKSMLWVCKKKWL